jgi:phosphopentomutase
MVRQGVKKLLSPIKKRRVFVVIIDGCGVGASPDAAAFGDSSANNTLGNVALSTPDLELPTLWRLGMANITKLSSMEANDHPIGFFGKLKELSNGKDTQTGHWELMGIINDQAFPTYPEGFPQPIIDEFIKRTGCKSVLGNRPASGTEILEQLGPEHQKTGFPIVYTSGDSVFQIACHVETVPLATLYKWCEIARGMLDGPNRVGRVIARPFTGAKGGYVRLQGDRRDLGVPPPKATLLDELIDAGTGVLGIGKIEDIFCGQGLSHAKHTARNAEGLALTLAAVKGELDLNALRLCDSALSNVEMIFTNLVDTDSMFGHRRDVKGYAQALIEIDHWLDTILSQLALEDLLVISSDHGNDPTAQGTDHTREYVPLILYSPSFESGQITADTGSHDLGVRDTFADVGATIASWFSLPWSKPGVSCLRQATKVAS